MLEFKVVVLLRLAGLLAPRKGMFLRIEKLINCEKDLISSQSNHEKTNLHNSSQTS